MIINLIAGVLGIVLYTLIKARAFIAGKKHDEFDLSVFVNDNFLGWIWSFTALTLLWVVLLIVPEATELIGNMFGGIDINATPLGFLLMGNALGFGGKEFTDNKK